MSVIIPSRGRPMGLLRAVRSCGNGAEVIVGLDDDDALEPKANEMLRGMSHVFAVVMPRHKTLGALANALARRSRGQYLFFLADDYVIDEPDWVARLTDAASALPNRIGVLFPADPLHPGFPGQPIISRRVFDTLGYFMSPHFPFWFADTWWDEIGRMSGLLAGAGFSVHAPDGKGETHGMADLAFWVDFFERTRLLRVRDALKLGGMAFKDWRARLAADVSSQQMCALRTEHLRDPIFLERWSKKGDAPPSERYLEAKADAERVLEGLKHDVA